MGVEPKIPVLKTPKMDGLFHGKPYYLMDDLGVFQPIFLETPRSTLYLLWLSSWDGDISNTARNGRFKHTKLVTPPKTSPNVGGQKLKKERLKRLSSTIFQGTFVSFCGSIPTVDGSEIRLYNQLRLVVYIIIYKVLAPSLVVQDFFHQQYVIPWNYPPPPG